jgi:hypothetical protein
MFPSLPTPLYAVGLSTLRKAQSQIGSCQACNRRADIPFYWVLDHVMGQFGTAADYVLSKPARCPNCAGAVYEHTLIQWN